MSTSFWSRQDSDSLAQLNCGDFGVPTSPAADVNVSGLPTCFQCDITSSEKLVLEVHWFFNVFLFMLYRIVSLILH
jgi:hypothetical protein